MADKTPTEAEVKTAQAVLQRAAEAQQKEADAKLQPIRDITASAEFTNLREKIEALPVDFMADMNIAPHIMALRAGLNGLVAIAPAPVPTADASAPTGGASA